jgi:hypothetical protein
VAKQKPTVCAVPVADALLSLERYGAREPVGHQKSVRPENQQLEAGWLCMSE